MSRAARLLLGLRQVATVGDVEGDQSAPTGPHSSRTLRLCGEMLESLSL